MEDEKNGATPPPPWFAKAVAEIAEARRVIGRLANATLKVHYAQQRAGKTGDLNSATLERIERKIGEQAEKLAVAISKIESVEDDVEDITGQHQLLPLPSPQKDLSIEQHVQAAKTWLTVAWPALKWTVIAIGSSLGWAYHFLTAHGH